MVTIVEFSDYECPFCRALEPRLQQLVSAHPGRIALYRYDLPLEKIHPYAMAAAIAADCAAMQGVTEAYQIRLFRANLAELNWNDLAEQTGVRSLSQFQNCIGTRASLKSIDADLETSRKLEIYQTPTLVVNGTMIEGAIESDELERLYRDATEAAR